MSEELMEVQSQGIIVMRDPSVVLAEAKKAATALMTVVSQKKKPVIMNGEQYLEFEDWQTVAQFYGLSAKIVSTKFVDLNGVHGYEATAECIRNSDGMVLSSADAMCLNDEDKWSTRTKYEWVDGKKTKVGEVPVPLFQLRSMAQTRACAKVFRNKLAWVAVLAGFKPTPAEEITGQEFNNAPTKPAMQKPQSQSSQTEDAIVYMDIITMLQGTKGAKLNVIAFGIAVKHDQLNKKDKSGKVDISSYTVGDLASNPTATAVIKVFGKPLDIGSGAKIKFNGVEIGDYQGKAQYVAQEASV